MKIWAPIIALLLLSGCGAATTKHYYQLPVNNQAASTYVSDSGQQLWVEYVSVADFLSKNGLVYQTDEVQYTLAQNNLWASALDQQLQQTLVANLSTALSGWLVSTHSVDGHPTTTLNVVVNGFHGRYDGYAVINGEWVLSKNGHSIKQPFNLALPLADEGYDALVKTLAQGWQQEAQVIAAQATKLAAYP